MEEIKLWSVDGAQVKDLKPVGGMKSEKFLEDTLVENSDLLMEDLTLVGRQTQTEGGPLDLMGVDGDGRLVVFELKRGTLSRDAVAQVIDYASYLDSMDLDALCEHISQRSGSYGIDEIEDFQSWYTNDLGFEDLESLKPLRTFLVGLGVDTSTERMVKFLAENSGMDISLLTFHGFNYEGKTILAKQMEVDGASAPSPKPKKPTLSRDEKLEHLSGLAESFSDIRNLFLENWNEGSETVLTHSSYFLLRRVWYAGVFPQNGRVRIFFYPWTIRLCEGAFDSAKTAIPSEPSHYNKHGEGIDFLIEQDEWATHKDELTKLIQSIYKAWQDKER